MNWRAFLRGAASVMDIGGAAYRRRGPGRNARRRPHGDSLMVQISPGMYVPSGHDPYGPHFTEDDCVLSTATGECIRDHARSGPHDRVDVR